MRASLALLFLIACDRPAAKTTSVVAQVEPTPSAGAATIDREATPVADAGPADAGAKVVDRCPPPGAGKTNDDLTPPIRGGKDDVPALFDWLDARGVTKSAAVAWYMGRYGGGKLSREMAEMIFGSASCKTIAVGDKAEEAVLCTHTIPYSWMQTRVLVLTVRKKQIAPVLDVGLGMRALDWPDARHLDLAFSIDADGKNAELVERAPDGTILVETQSACRAREAATKTNGVPVLPTGMGYPATLHDCAGGIAMMKSSQSDAASSDASIKKEARDALSFVERACKDRGRYVWRGDKFVRP